MLGCQRIILWAQNIIRNSVLSVDMISDLLMLVDYECADGFRMKANKVNDLNGEGRRKN